MIVKAEEKLFDFKMLISSTFLCILVLTPSITAKTTGTRHVSGTITLPAENFLSQLLATAGMEHLGKEKLALLKVLLGNGDVEDTLDKVKSFFKTIPGIKVLSNIMINGKRIHKDILKPFIKIAGKMSKLNQNKTSKSNSNVDGIFEVAERYLNANFEGVRASNDSRNSTSFESEAYNAEDTSSDRTKSMFIELAKTIFQNSGSLSPILVPSASSTSTETRGANMTMSTMWMVAKSTWQRVLSYVREENSLEYFMQLTPVKIIDRIMSLGDEVNLMNFLAKKLDPDFAEFLAIEINPYLGPLKDFNSFYNFTKENELNGIIDYFRSEKFSYTVNAMTRFVSAYLEDTVSDDVVNQYIEFISFNNTELYNFYKSVLRNQGKIIDSDDADPAPANATHRYKRNVLQDIASSYTFNEDSDHIYRETTTTSARQLQRYGAPSNVGSTGSLVYDPSRDGGYGGGGYGGGGYGGGYGYGMNMKSLDPYVILGSLALGTILGFLLYRALRGTGGGRRDIGDGSLSLWQSDVPENYLPWGTSADRMKRHVQNFNMTGGDEFNLPDSLRGDVWSSDPLVGDHLLDDQYEEDDIADHLNQLWRVYKQSNESACVQSHLCDVMTNSTAEHLTGKDSSLALMMASVGNFMGVTGSGQLIDDVAKNLVLGEVCSCPSFSYCHHYL